MRKLSIGLLILLTLVALAAPQAMAMQVAIAGNQLILTGRVLGGDYGRIFRTLVAKPDIATVILRNSPGGDALTGFRVGELFRTRGLTTAVSGYCHSSCSRMFLGGKVRMFTDDYPPAETEIGFHGIYDLYGRLNSAAVQQLGLKDWIVAFSDGKADPALVERWINIPTNRGLIHFFHPALLANQPAATFFCGSSEARGSVFGCEPEARTALDLGIITSLGIIASNDQAALRAGLLGNAQHTPGLMPAAREPQVGFYRL